ncbi:MAG TPA: ribosome maturation factor RimP [Vicinamibacterales bacterium]|nr:ribosome maturation factor RimP [Vicinamibacterales bacterium]
MREAAGRVAASYGLEIFDVQIRREPVGWVLRVVIDRPDAGEGTSAIPGGEPVGIEDCQHVSRDLSALLDVEDALTEGLDREFTLEVSSPGLDRPLRGEADYRRFVGRLAKVVTREPVEGQSHFAGRLAGVEDGFIVMTEGRRTHRVPLALVSRARLEVEM